MKFFVPLALTATLLTVSSVASADRSYVAKVNENNEFCARIKPIGIAGLRSHKTCKTIEEWKAAGYRVDVKKPVGNIEKTAEV